MNQINNLEKIISFDKFGNLDQVYIVDTLDPKSIIEKQEYNYYKNRANENLVPFLNSRTFYSYNTNRSLNKILFTKEESIESYLLFIDAINLHENNTEIRFWKFQSTISKKAFIEKKGNNRESIFHRKRRYTSSSCFL